MAQEGRIYGGRSEQERRSDRRHRLLAAGLELFGTEGWSGATIERLCHVAGVATRSFYEEFSSREALLLAVYEDVMGELVTGVLPRLAATTGTDEQRLRAGISGYVDYLTQDPRRARVVHREIRAAGVLEPERQRMLLRFADLIVREMHLGDLAGVAERRVLALALAGAVTEVLVDWVAQPEPRSQTGPIVETLVRVFVAVVNSTPVDAHPG